MTIDYLSFGLFTTAAIVLLGSPGPAIAALVAVGRDMGFKGGLKFFAGLQIGLATAAAISAAGLFSALQAVPAATIVMGIVATSYLTYLAYKIATAPVGEKIGSNSLSFASTPTGGFLLGVTNPKGYVAFISLMAAHVIVPSNSSLDTAAKWLTCVIIMIVVDLIWMWLGDVIRKSNMSLNGERTLNIAMGATVLATAFLPYF